MRLEEKLKNIKKVYLKVEPPEDLVRYGWFSLREEIAKNEEIAKKEYSQKSPFAIIFPTPLFARGLTFAVVILMILALASSGLVYASQKSLPGDILYPLKRFSETITFALRGDKQAKVEKRAEDVVGAANKKKDGNIVKESISEAVEEYKKAVLETKKEILPQQKKELDDKLKKQEKLFEETVQKSPAVKDELERAIETSRKGQEDIKINERVKGVQEEVTPRPRQELDDKLKKQEKLFEETVQKSPAVKDELERAK